MTEAARQAALAAEASTVKTPYLILGSIILAIAIIFALMKLPEIKEEEVESNNDSSKKVLHALKHKHLSWAVIAQFFYVGAQVCIFSFFILFATAAADITQMKAAEYAGYGVGMAFMIGRFVGTFFMKYIQPPRLLAIYSIICVILCVFAMFTEGMIAIYSVIGIAFFMSIMFPTIFSLGIKDLNSDTKFGSSLIIMAIVGGAILPPIYGYISDVTNNIQLGYAVPLVCFIVIFYFGVKGYKVNKPA
jgi:FHS family L-fucose permease-like MFS transporter